MRGAFIVLGLLACSPASSLPEGRDPQVRRQLPADFVALLEQADTFEVLALDDGESFSEVPGFPQYRVRARVAVDDAAARLAVVRALYQGVRDATLVAVCFRPHHAIHTRRGVAELTIPICFGCRQIQVPPRANGVAFVGIDPEPLVAALGAIFQRHGLRFDRAIDHFGAWRQE